jgi:hypothetical protein
MTASHQFQQILLFLGAFVNSIHQQGDTRTTGFVENRAQHWVTDSKSRRSRRCISSACPYSPLIPQHSRQVVHARQCGRMLFAQHHFTQLQPFVDASLQPPRTCSDESAVMPGGLRSLVCPNALCPVPLSLSSRVCRWIFPASSYQKWVTPSQLSPV